MRTIRAKVAYVVLLYVVIIGALVLMEVLNAPAELTAVVLTVVMMVMFGGMGALWEFPDEPPRERWWRSSSSRGR
jgi:ABC-type multidrug transport system permease subunit